MAKEKTVLLTLQDIANYPEEVLLAEHVAPFLNCDPNTIRWQAHNEPEKLGFPVCVWGRQVRIPRDAFVFYHRYGRPVIQDPDSTDFSRMGETGT